MGGIEQTNINTKGETMTRLKMDLNNLLKRYDLLKKVRGSSTDALREYMRWCKEGVQV